MECMVLKVLSLNTLCACDKLLSFESNMEVVQYTWEEVLKLAEHRNQATKSIKYITFSTTCYSVARGLFAV